MIKKYQLFKSIDQQQSNLLIILLLFSGFAFYLTLFYPYQGEEGVYTMQSYEMWFHHQYLIPLEYGKPYWRPPLYNWLIIGLSNLLGWTHMLQASRIISATATILTGVILYQFTKRLFQHTDFAKFTILVYFSGDLLFRRGWLAYSDPVFSLWVALAICCIWLAIRENRIHLVIFANLALIAGVLTKAVIIYVFYLLAVAVISLSYRNIRFLFKPRVILIHCITLLSLGLWFYLTPIPKHGSGMIADITHKFRDFNLLSYSALFISKPFDLFIHLTPFSFIALASIFLTTRDKQKNTLDQKTIYNCLLIFLLCYLPFWLSTTTTSMRYIQPFYFLLAIVLASLIWSSKQALIRISIVAAIIGILFKYAISFAGGNILPKYHANFGEIAHDILSLTQDKPLYVADKSFTGYSITSRIDPQIYPASPIIRPPSSLENGFIISRELPTAGEELVQAYPIPPKITVYLNCAGSACNVPYQ